MFPLISRRPKGVDNTYYLGENKMNEVQFF